MKKLTILNSLLIVALMVICALQWNSSPKLGYVRSHDLVYSYDGMKEALQKFEERKLLLSANLDSLKAMYQADIARFTKESSTLTESERMIQQGVIEDQFKALIDYNQSIENQLKKEEEEMLNGVLAQVNEQCKSFAETHDYTAVLGTTLSGSLLYGEDAIDLTDELLVVMNNQYNDRQ